MDSKDKIKKFYDSEVIREWERMDRHPLEFGVTMRYMDKCYPKSGEVLDVGGGPGRYSIMLAKKGYDVTLVDISPKNVEFAADKAKDESVHIRAICADALDLGRHVTEKFDIVQCMGPLYHLLSEEDRINCVRQCLDRLKPGGVFVASFISSYAVLADVIAKYPQEVPQFKRYFSDMSKDMTNVESEENPGFTDAYFTYPLNIGPFFQKFGLNEIVIAGVEGPAGLNEPVIREMSDEIVAEWVDISYRLSQDRLTWGTNQHFIYIGRKDG